VRAGKGFGRSVQAISLFMNDQFDLAKSMPILLVRFESDREQRAGNFAHFFAQKDAFSKSGCRPCDPIQKKDEFESVTIFTVGLS
jgi:hypothetical protein